MVESLQRAWYGADEEDIDSVGVNIKLGDLRRSVLALSLRVDDEEYEKAVQGWGGSMTARLKVGDRVAYSG